MSHPQDDLLKKELAKLGAKGGKMGGGTAGSIGGSMGASFAARFLPTEQHQQEIRVARDVATVLSQVTGFLAKQGRIADDQEAGTSEHPKISAVVGSGFFKMNPTVVHVEVIECSDNACVLSVTAAAKEGLIKQHSAEKVVRQVIAFLQSLG